MTYYVISIPEDGAAQAVYTDALLLSVIGTQRVRRAGEIIWSETKQAWTVSLISKRGAAVSPEEWGVFETYEEARGFEGFCVSLGIMLDQDITELDQLDLRDLYRLQKKSHELQVGS